MLLRRWLFCISFRYRFHKVLYEVKETAGIEDRQQEDSRQPQAERLLQIQEDVQRLQEELKAGTEQGITREAIQGITSPMAMAFLIRGGVEVSRGGLEASRDHTCATLLLSRGVHPKFVQELLGHPA